MALGRVEAEAMRGPSISLVIPAWPSQPIGAALNEWHRTRTVVFDRIEPRAWMRVPVAIVAYVLLCTDVLRSGLGVRGIDKRSPLEPNSIQFFRPWAYPVQQIYNNDSSVAAKVWSYKFDTTSVCWRAFARYYNLTVFPPCILYHGACPSLLFSKAQAFAMIDAIANSTAVHSQRQTRKADLEPREVTISSKATFYDRIHHYLIPQVFLRPWRRTNQAIYYSPKLLQAVRQLDVCGFRTARPSFCRDVWPNFRRSCQTHKPECLIGHVSVDIRRRFERLRTKYAGLHIDLTVLSSSEDALYNPGAYTSEYYRRFDMSTIFRVRTCDTLEGCSTLYVDEYRYEGAIFTLNGQDWFTFVALLRITAQMYFLLRLVLLVVGCYVARRSEERYHHASVRVVVIATLRTLARVPCQVISHGSVIPAILYSAAHCVDSTTAYRIISQQFTTMGGNPLAFDFFTSCIITATQMRNLWLMSMTLQCCVWLSTRYKWSSTNGIVGLPPYYLSLISSITIVAQYRSLSFRSSQVIDVSEDPRAGQHLALIRTLRPSRNPGSVTLEGVLMDVKCLGCLLVLFSAISVVAWAGLSACHRRPQKRVGIMPSHTPVPYSAGTLWPTMAMSIYWSAKLFPPCPDQRQSPHIKRKGAPSFASPRVSQGPEMTVAPSTSRNPATRRQPLPPRKDRWATESTRRLRYARQQFERVHERANDIKATVALMNLLAMTDPWVFIQLRVWRGHDVCYLQHATTGKVCCVPATAMVLHHQVGSVPWESMHVLAIVNSKSMRWSDLLHCG